MLMGRQGHIVIITVFVTAVMLAISLALGLTFNINPVFFGRLKESKHRPRWRLPMVGSSDLKQRQAAAKC
jgi:hypothetical protein